MTAAPVADRSETSTSVAPTAARRGADRVVLRVVLGVTVVYALVVGGLAVARYEAFASDFDHGIFTQYTWLLGHLHEPFNTVVLRTLLGDHVEPGIVLLAPLGTLGVAATGILVAQTLALAATAPLLFLLAREHGATGWLAAVPALLWCASPVVLHPALLDFHPEALVPALLAGGLLALARGRTGWFAVSVVLACAMKEDVGLTYAALGLVLAWEGRRRLGWLLAGATAAYSLFAVYVVLPAFGNAAEQEFGPRFAGGRGDSILDVVRYSVVHPLTTIQQTLTLEDLGIVFLLFLTTGGLCLFAPRWLLLAVPATALNVFSAYELQHTIDYHYWIVAAGAIAVAGAVGAGRVPRRGSPHVARLGCRGRHRPLAPLAPVGGGDRPSGPHRVAPAGRPAGDRRRRSLRRAGQRADATPRAPRGAEVDLRPARADDPGSRRHPLGDRGESPRDP